LIVLLLAVALLGPAVAAAIELLHLLVIVAALIGGICMAGGVPFPAPTAPRAVQAPTQARPTIDLADCARTCRGCQLRR
jgi:hypothetical protein